jgi:hypothetical protein
LSRAHAEKSHLDPQIVARALHRAEHDGIGAKLTPCRERNLLERTRRGTLPYVSRGIM